MSCEAKFVSLKIEQVSGNIYMAAAAPGGHGGSMRLGLLTGYSCPC